MKHLYAMAITSLLTELNIDNKIHFCPKKNS